MNRAVVAAGDVEIAIAVERQAGGIHQLGDERLHRVVRRDFVERDGNFLPALAAEGDVDVSFGIHRGIRHGMQIVGDLHAQRHREGRALDAAHAHAHRAARGAFRHARDQMIFRGHHQTAFGLAELHLRPRVIASAESAAVNRDFAAREARPASRFRCAVCRSFSSSTSIRIAMFAFAIACAVRESGTAKSSCPRDPQSERRVDSGDPIVRHDSQAAGKGFGLPRRKRLPNIEDSKKYKTQQQIFPVERRERRTEVGREIWPETSSITTNCGSFLPENFAARSAAQTPTSATRQSRSQAVRHTGCEEPERCSRDLTVNRRNCQRAEIDAAQSARQPAERAPSAGRFGR